MGYVRSLYLARPRSSTFEGVKYLQGYDAVMCRAFSEAVSECTPG